MPPVVLQSHQLTLPEGWTPPKYQLGQKVLVNHKYEPEAQADFGIVTGFNTNSFSTYPGCDGRLPGWDYTITLHPHSPMWSVYGGMGVFSEDELSPNS